MSSPTDLSFHRARTGALLAVMFCYLFYYTGRQNFGFAIAGMSEELGLSKTQLGWCSTAMLWSYAIGQAINGPLADRFGGRILMSLGGILSFAMNAITSFATGLTGILIPWAFNGLFQSMGWAPGSRILSNWWDQQHRGRVYGWYVFAAGMSSVVTYVMGNIVQDHGWRWIFRGPTTLMLLGGAIFFLIIRERPSKAGFEDLPPDESGSTDAPEPQVELLWWQRYAVGLRCFPFLVGCLAIGFQNLARYGLLVWIPVHFLGSDWKSDRSQQWISVALPVGMALGAVTAGWLSDRLFHGRRSAPVILFLLLASVCSAGMAALPRDSFAAIPLLFLTGFFVYGPQSAFWALCPDLLGRKLAGTGTGMMNFFAYLIAGLGEPLIGRLIDTTHSTHTIFMVVATACILGAALMSLIRQKA